MKKLIILCMDGLDPYYAEKLDLHMPYEKSLFIPVELFHYGVPHTLHVWPSIFLGMVRKHPDLVYSVNNPLIVNARSRIRRALHKMGIQWKRSGLKIFDADDQKNEGEFKPIVFNSSVEYKETVFANYNSFIHDLPGICDGILLGGSIEWSKRAHKLFKLLVSISPLLQHQIIAVYTRYPDYLVHRKMDVDFIYKEGFMHANELMDKNNVMLLSDHGSSSETGMHTDHAYIGANFSFKAESVLDIRSVIENIMCIGKTVK